MRVALAQPTADGSEPRPVALAAVIDVYTDAVRIHVLYQLPDAKVSGAIAKPVRSAERVRLSKYVARIAEIEEGGRVRLDIGEADHVEAGDIYTVLSEGHYDPIGRVRITAIEKLTAWASVLDRYEPLRQDQEVTYLGPPGSAKVLPITILVTNFDPADPANAEQVTTGRSFAKELAKSLGDAATGTPYLKVRYEPGARVKLDASEQAAEADARAIGKQHGADIVVWGSMRCGKRACAEPRYTVVYPERLQSRNYRGEQIWMDRDDAGFSFKGDAPEDPIALGAAILGSVAYKAERYADAAYHLSRAVSKGVLRGEDELRARAKLTYAFYVTGQRVPARSQANQLMARAKEQGKARWKNVALAALADIEGKEGQVAEAAGRYRSIIAWSEAQKDSGLLGKALHELAGLEAQQGRVDKARELYERSLTLERSIRDAQGEAATLHQLAGIEARQGRVDKARELYERSLTLGRSIRDVQGEAATLHNLALLEAQQGRVDKAHELFERSLTLSRSVGHVQGEAAVLHHFAGLEAQQGRVDKARELYDRSLMLFRSIEHVQGEASALHNLAGLEAQQGRVDKARELHDRSLTLFRSIGHVQGEATALNNLAGLEAQQGRVDKARELYERSLTLRRSIGNVHGEAATLHNLAFLEAQQGRADKARELYGRSLTLKRSIRDVSGEVATLSNLAVLDFRDGKRPEARRALEEALERARTIHDVKAQASSLALLGQLEMTEGRPAEARAHLTAALTLLTQLKMDVEAAGIQALLEKLPPPPGMPPPPNGP